MEKHDSVVGARGSCVKSSERQSSIIYENEQLKIQVARLNGIVGSIDISHVNELKSENASLQQAVEHLRSQLAEKEQRLSMLSNSIERFSHIDELLKDLIVQLNEQRAETADMKKQLESKQGRISELSDELKRSHDMVATLESDIQSHRSSAVAAETNDTNEPGDVGQPHNNNDHEANAQLENENSALRAEIDAAKAEKNEMMRQLAAITEEAKERGEQVHVLRHQLDVKCAAGEQQCRVHQNEIKQLEQTRDELRQRLATAVEEMVQFRAEHELNKDDLAHAREQLAVAKAQQQQRSNPPSSSAEASATYQTRSTHYDQEMETCVQQRVREAVAAMQKRLQEQTDLNASLLSAKSLAQYDHERSHRAASVAGVQKELATNDVKSKQHDLQQDMHRCVAQVFASNTIDKKAFESLLQQMLDYQEIVNQDTSTQLLIKDIKAEESEKTLTARIKRLEAENSSILQQLREAIAILDQIESSHPEVIPKTALSGRRKDVVCGTNLSMAVNDHTGKDGLVLNHSGRATSASRSHDATSLSHADPSMCEVGVIDRSRQKTAVFDKMPSLQLQKNTTTDPVARRVHPPSGESHDQDRSSPPYENVSCPACKFSQCKNRKICLACGRILPRIPVW